MELFSRMKVLLCPGGFKKTNWKLFCRDPISHRILTSVLRRARQRAAELLGGGVCTQIQVKVLLNQDFRIIARWSTNDADVEMHHLSEALNRVWRWTFNEQQVRVTLDVKQLSFLPPVDLSAVNKIHACDIIYVRGGHTSDHLQNAICSSNSPAAPLVRAVQHVVMYDEAVYVGICEGALQCGSKGFNFWYGENILYFANTGPRDMPPTEHLSGALVLNSGCSIAVDAISARRRDVPAGSPELSASMFPTTAQQSWDWRRYASEFTPFLDRWVQGVAAVRHAHYFGQWWLFLLRGECYVPDPILDDMWVPPNARTPTGPAIQYADI